MLFQRPRLVFARDVDALRDSRENQSLNYAPEDMDAAKTKAAEDAYRRGRESAVALARSSGRTLGSFPMPRWTRSSARAEYPWPGRFLAKKT